MWTNNGDIMFALGKLGVPALTSGTRGILNVTDFVNSMGGFTLTSGSKSGNVAFKSYSSAYMGISKLNAPYFVDSRAFTTFYQWNSGSYSSGFTLGIGSGTTPASKSDYKLETPYAYNTDYQGYEGVCTVTNSDTQTVITQSVDVKALKDMTISEVSLVTCYDSNTSSNSSFSPSYVMVFRELLSTPLTLKATETATFNFTFIIEHATGRMSAMMLNNDVVDTMTMSNDVVSADVMEDAAIKDVAAKDVVVKDMPIKDISSIKDMETNDIESDDNTLLTD